MLLIRLVKRNILVYVRDRANIFYSLLSMLIIIGLMVNLSWKDEYQYDSISIK